MSAADAEGRRPQVAAVGCGDARLSRCAAVRLWGCAAVKLCDYAAVGCAVVWLFGCWQPTVGFMAVGLFGCGANWRSDSDAITE